MEGVYSLRAMWLNSMSCPVFPRHIRKHLYLQDLWVCGEWSLGRVALAVAVTGWETAAALHLLRVSWNSLEIRSDGGLGSDDDTNSV